MRWGEQSTDEMGSVSLQVVAASERDLPELQQAFARHVRDTAVNSPIGKMLIATGKLPLAADRAVTNAHPASPPPTAASVEFGRHISGVCMGCHRENYAGGPIVGGDPSWAPARNLTPGPDGLASWSYEQFVKAMREGVRPDGTPVKPPMTLITPYAKYPNVGVKLSAIPGWSNEPYPFRDMTEHVRTMFEAFGPRRSFWGTDLTHQRGKYAYRLYVTHFTEELTFLSDADRKWVMGDALLAFLNWR